MILLWDEQLICNIMILSILAPDERSYYAPETLSVLVLLCFVMKYLFFDKFKLSYICVNFNLICA